MKPPAREAPQRGGSIQASRRPLLVKKFGGTSVADIECIQRAARLALESQRAGKDVVMVVSAMAGETDRLLKLAHQVLPAPDSRELDVLAATGEQVSVALVALAIQAAGGRACSFLGHQLPVRTDSAFTRARIQGVEQGPLRRALNQGQIAVVAGFQGVDPDNNITTLGRGGSDITAVAVAAALRAEVCEIYTDVDGIYTADPRVCPSSRKLRALPYEEMLELASRGAKVLHARSVEIAMNHQVPLHVRGTFSEEEGTRIVSRELTRESRRLVGLTCEQGQARVELLGVETLPELRVELPDLLAELRVSVDMLSQALRPQENGRADIAFTLPEGELRRARRDLEQSLDRLGGARELRVSDGLAKVSLVGTGLRSDPRIAARLCRSLKQQGISVAGLVVDEVRISCLLEANVADQAVRILHDAFGLADETPVQSLASGFASPGP